MSLTLVTAPTVYPLIVSEVADHLRMSETESTARLFDLVRLITDATAFVEDFTWRALITQTWDYFLDAWPDERYIVVPKPLLQSVTGVYYTEDGEAEVEFTDVAVDSDSQPGRVILEHDYTWPSVTLTPANPIRIRFVAGYGDEGSDVPPRIKQAMLLHIAQNYTGEPHKVNYIDPIESILRNYRIKNWQYDS